MRVIVEAMQGPHSRKIVLREGQSVRVGRSSMADYPFTHDDRMSGLHFSVSVTRTACQLVDLGSTNGTLFDGAPIRQMELHDGDEFVAGQTTFRVSMSSAAGESTLNQEGSGGTTSGSAIASTSRTVRKKHEIGCQWVRLSEHVVKLRGPDVPPRDAWRAALEACEPFMEQLAIQWLAHPFGVGAPIPASLQAMPLLFDHLPEASAQLVSPRYVPAERTDLVPNLLETLWGPDCLTGLVTSTPTDLLPHLRAALRSFQDPRPSGIWGFFVPTVLRSQLAVGPSKLLDQFWLPLHSILLASPQGNWEIYTRQGADDRLAALGFRAVAAEA